MTIRWKVAQFFEINWWKQYLKGKSTEEYLTYKRNYWKNFIPQLGLIFDKEDTFLIAGCGPSGIYMVLEDYKVDAIDPLLREYEKNLPHFSKSNYPNIQFKQKTIESLTTDTAYNKVFCLNVINHVHDIERAMDLLADTVQPKGDFILSIDAHNIPFLKKLFRLFPYLDILHPHQYDLQEYEAMMTSRGFQLEKTILVTPGKIFNYYVMVGKKI